MDKIPEETPPFEDIQKDLSNLLKNKYNVDAIFGFGSGPRPQEAPKEPPHTNPVNLDFAFKPKEVKAYLDRYVIKQDEAKKALAIAICDHYNHIKRVHSGADDKNYVKQNILMIGPTGVGKTYLIKTIASLIGVPFIKGDATKYSETGYVGGDVDDLVRQLVKKADGNVDLAQYGIIFIDEIDKIYSASSPSGRDVGGRGVQSNLLKLMEETEVPLVTPWDIQSQMQMLMGKSNKPNKDAVNTKHILFIVSGVFDGLTDAVKKRLKGSNIGFVQKDAKEQTEYDYLGKTATEDLIKFGFEPEFIGRLPIRVFCHDLAKQDLFDILKHSEGSILRQYISSFEGYGIKVLFEDEALMTIAQEAIKEKTGARSLGTVLEKIFRDYKFELPSTDIKYFVADKAVIQDPGAELQRLISNPDYARKQYHKLKILEYVDSLAKRTGLEIAITPEAEDYIASQCIKDNLEVEKYCQQLLNNYEYGLNLIKKNKPDSVFTVDMTVVQDPDKAMEDSIKASFK